MTDQIERELTEMFRERAVHLDVLPPMPAARVRRARLHTALAMASVVAVLASVGVAGMRLAAGPGNGSASIAASGSPRSALERISARMLAGRWRVVVTMRDTSGSAPNTVAPHPGPATEDMEIEYDGQTKSGIASQNGRTVALQVNGVTYTPLGDMVGQITKYLPKGARWQRAPIQMFGADPASNVLGLSGGSAHTTGGSAAVGLDTATVRRTSDGFVVDAQDGDRRSHTEIVLRADGTIASTHTVEKRQDRADSNGGTAQWSTGVIDATYTPLTAPLAVSAPDPATVVTDAQLQAAIHKSMFGPGPLHTAPCPGTGPQPSPVVVQHRIMPGGSITTTQSSTILSCAFVKVMPKPGEPATSPSPH